MSEQAVEENRAPLSLVERKQRAARSRIVAAADELFAERGFDSVSVTDIAERAEVGRTTFFRHFGDKTEVVFAKEQAMFDAVEDAASAVRAPAPSADSLAGGLRALEPLVVRLCEQATADLEAYHRHTLLLEAHEELRARDALKKQYLSHELAKVLLNGGTSPAVATTAAQLALACYASGRLLAAAPDELVAGVRAAFRSTLAMHAGAAEA